jgi:hypothetical protein
VLVRGQEHCREFKCGPLGSSGSLGRYAVPGDLECLDRVSLVKEPGQVIPRGLLSRSSPA